MGLIVEVIRVLGTELPRTIFKCPRKCVSDRRLDGKVVVITGGNSGLGKEVTKQLSLRGAKIIIGCRNEDKSKTAINEISELNPKATISALKLDLSSLTSVRHFAKQLEERVDKIDILINNAGIPVGPEEHTEDGFELQLGGNYLGHFLLTLHLIPLLKKSSNARIISVSTSAYPGGKINFENINLANGAYGPLKSHLQSKLALVMFTKELAKRLGENSNIHSYVISPGMVNSRPAGNALGTFMKKVIMLNLEDGVQTYLYCALDESLDNESGHYYDNCVRVDRRGDQLNDDKCCENLWEMSSDLVKLENNFKL